MQLLSVADWMHSDCSWLQPSCSDHSWFFFELWPRAGSLTHCTHSLTGAVIRFQGNSW